MRITTKPASSMVVVVVVVATVTVMGMDMDMDTAMATCSSKAQLVVVVGQPVPAQQRRAASSMGLQQPRSLWRRQVAVPRTQTTVMTTGTTMHMCRITTTLTSLAAPLLFHSCYPSSSACTR